MAEPHDPPKTAPGTQHENGMVTTARYLERHHTSPAPEAAEPLPHPFPATVLRWLRLGALFGALVGLAVGILLYNGTLVVPGWEQLYSAGNVTFYTLWTLFGAAAGILIVGGGTLLAVSPEPYEPASVDNGSRD